MQKDTDLIVKIVGILVLAAISLFIAVKIYQSLPNGLTCWVENPFNEFQRELCTVSKNVGEYL